MQFSIIHHAETTRPGSLPVETLTLLCTLWIYKLVHQTDLQWWRRGSDSASNSVICWPLKLIFHSFMGNGLEPYWPMHGSALTSLIQLWSLTHYSDVIMSVMVSQITGISIVCSTVCSATVQRKHQSSVSLVFVRGIHWWLVDSLHKGPVTRKMFPFDDVIMPYWGFPTTDQRIMS